MRRVPAVLIAAIPFAVVAYCLASDARFAGARAVGWGAFGLGALVCITNAYAGWVRPWVRPHARRASGFPLVGTALVVVGLAFLPASKAIAIGALVLIAIDTGGPLWFVLSTWRDGELWRTTADS